VGNAARGPVPFRGTPPRRQVVAPRPRVATPLSGSCRSPCGEVSHFRHTATAAQRELAYKPLPPLPPLNGRPVRLGLREGARGSGEPRVAVGVARKRSRPPHTAARVPPAVLRFARILPPRPIRSAKRSCRDVGFRGSTRRSLASESELRRRATSSVQARELPLLCIGRQRVAPPENLFGEIGQRPRDPAQGAGHSQSGMTERYIHAAQVLFPGRPRGETSGSSPPHRPSRRSPPCPLSALNP